MGSIARLRCWLVAGGSAVRRISRAACARPAGRAAELMALKVKGLRALCISLSRSPLHLADAAAAAAAVDDDDDDDGVRTKSSHRLRPASATDLPAEQSRAWTTEEVLQRW